MNTKGKLQAVCFVCEVVVHTLRACMQKRWLFGDDRRSEFLGMRKLRCIRISQCVKQLFIRLRVCQPKPR